MYNENYYKNGKMLQLRPYAEAIHTFKTGDGTIAYSGGYPFSISGDIRSLPS